MSHYAGNWHWPHQLAWINLVATRRRRASQSKPGQIAVCSCRKISFNLALRTVCNCEITVMLLYPQQLVRLPAVGRLYLCCFAVAIRLRHAVLSTRSPQTEADRSLQELLTKFKSMKNQASVHHGGLVKSLRPSRLRLEICEKLPQEFKESKRRAFLASTLCRPMICWTSCPPKKGPMHSTSSECSLTFAYISLSPAL
jgi:hypothetical protein